MARQKRVGPYELKETLGRGTFSKVKRAINTETGDVVAIKIISIASLEKDGMERQVKKEITVLKSIRHRNVVRMIEVLKSANHIYIVMELICGGELFDRIVAAKRFDEDTARHYFHQLIDGIAYCHARDIAHRDLKPENLLLSEDNETLKISDFGLSGIVENEQQQLTTICGTPHYVSPEVLTGKYDGMKADIWSCGIILFVMASGCHPFDGETVNELFKRIENLEFKYPSYFSQDLRVLLDKIIVVNPEKRATLDDIYNDKWFRVNYKQPVSSPSSSSDLQSQSMQSNGSGESGAGSPPADTDDHDTAITHVEVENDAASGVGVVEEVNPYAMKRNRDNVEALRQRRKNQTLSVRLQNTENLNAFELFGMLMKIKLIPLLSRTPRRNNHFIARGYPDDVYEKFVQFFKRSKCTVKEKDTAFEFKVKFKKTDLEVQVKMYPINHELVMVELLRLRGNTLKYHVLFRGVRDQFGFKMEGQEGGNTPQ